MSETAIVAETSATASTFVISLLRAKLLICEGSGAAKNISEKVLLFTFVELASGDVLRHDVLLVLAANTTGRRRGMLRLNVLFVDGLVLLWRHGMLSVVRCGGQLTVFSVSAVATDLGLVDKVLWWLAASVI